MVQPGKNVTYTVTILLVLFLQTTSQARRKKHICPIGYRLAYTEQKGDPICYRLKGPETFADKFLDCAGNLYTSTLFNSLNITKPDLVLWAEYKTSYPGGTFVDWSYTKTIGTLMTATYNVNYDPSLDLHQELCVVMDPVTGFTATRCEENHYRYCLIQPYSDDVSDKGCDSLRGFVRFYSPRSTCLAAVTGVGGGTVRATWKQSQEICEKRGGSLLNRGWRYSNNPQLHVSGSYPMYPLGVLLDEEQNSLRIDAENDTSIVPRSDWNFEDINFSSDTLMGAVRDNFWYLVNGSYIFYDVICEKSVELRTVELNVSVEKDNKLILSVNDSVDDENIYCFTDSVTFYPMSVKIKYDDDADVFVLKPITDGYYWCIHTDSKNTHISESNKVLFIREKQSLENLYAVKISVKREYSFEDIGKLYKIWEKKLKEYIFYRTKYVEEFGSFGPDNPTKVEDVLKSYKTSRPGLSWKEKSITYSLKIKQLYLDAITALLHMELNPEMMPVAPGTWDDLEVIYMKPAYYCSELIELQKPKQPLGTSLRDCSGLNPCSNFTCMGDFNEGVQWVTTAIDGCVTTPPTQVEGYIQIQRELVTVFSPTEEPSASDIVQYNRNSDSDEESVEMSITNATDISNIFTTEGITEWPSDNTTDTPVVTVTTPDLTTRPPKPPPTTTFLPTTELPSTQPPFKPPEEQLQQVMDDLESLINNDTISVMVEDIGDAFDQVDEILSLADDLAIPGQLLHLLDELGSRIFLNGSFEASAVRNNIALLVADAEPDQPVRGIRIASRDTDEFTEGAFEIISQEVNDTHLSVNKSEAVVHLPESVAVSTRRISFVVFRNDRAFHSNHTGFTVNSRVLSINVENLTHFEDGEVIDIHLNPVTEDPNRNESRTCAYWHFLEDGTGYWSQEGCTFIRAARVGLMDTCRCDHLTHFAEILIPKTVFPQAHEDALEIISIIGCIMSISGLMMVGLTAILFRSWRRDFSNKIWLQLCIAIFLLAICFLVIVFANFQEHDVICMLTGVALHYSVLASFCWMLVAAVLSYRRLVMVFTRDASHKLLRASAFAWGVPCAIIGILLSAAPHSYVGRFEEMTPSGAFCYPSGLALWLAVYAPIAIMLLTNWTLFILIVRSVFASRRIQRHGDSNEALRCASVSCLLVFLFGLPWIFGIFAYNLVAAYLFTLTATYQGFVLFIFFVCGNKKTRELWFNKLKIKQTRKVPVTSSTYTNRSTDRGIGSRVGGPATIEAKSSKPRSLATPDDSRFS